MNNKKIFITGGAGYVGCELTNFLINKGYAVTVLDLMIYGKDVFTPNENLSIIKGDIRDQKLLQKIIPGHDILIHLACISNDPSFELNPNLGKSINYSAFEPLVKISRESEVERFIFASSSSVYGIKNSLNVHENMSLEPLTDYSKLKVECEKILSNYQSNDFTTVTIRPATVCGFSKRQRLDVIVNLLTNLAYNKREITVFGGNQLRPNLHIKDMINAYFHLITSSKEVIKNKTYNAGYENCSVMELASIVKNIIGEDVKLMISESNDNRSYHISSDKIKNELNFSPKHTIIEAVNDLKEAFEKKFL